MSTILDKDPALPHPVKISMPGNSDTIVVADDISDQLVITTIAGANQLLQVDERRNARLCGWTVDALGPPLDARL